VCHRVVVSHRIADIWRVPKGSQKRDVRITLRLPEDLAAQIQAAADEDRRSKSDWIVIQIEKLLAKKAGRKPQK
jgi:metal-responsive CopG/Arc/MetJ family transcriptional regulator